MIYEKRPADLSPLDWAKLGLNSAADEVINKPAPSGLPRSKWAEMGLTGAKNLIQEVTTALSQPKVLQPGEEIVFE